MNRKTLAAAFPHTIPVLMGYLSIGIVYGWMMSAAGFAPFWTAAASVFVFAGSGQMLGVDLLSRAAPLADIAFLTLILNFRHLVYGLSMLEKFHDVKGLKKFYLIFALSDETYALLSGVQPPEGVDAHGFYLSIAALDQIYWIAGSIAGAVAGALITINTEGIDFAMTALFLVIATEQWLSGKRRLPAFLGLGGTLLPLLILGPDGATFLIPALVILVGGLLLLRPVLEKPERLEERGESL